MTTAVTKTSPKNRPSAKPKVATSKKAAAKNSPPAVEPVRFAYLIQPTGFEVVHEAIEDLKRFVESIDSWWAQDCQRALTNLGLLQRCILRVDRGSDYVMLDEDNDLDRALNRLLGPLK